MLSFCMSENQSTPPPESNQALPTTVLSSSAAELQLQQESLATNGIEKRQRLSPVSPRPVHIANSPVLKNQMELDFDFTDAHSPPPAHANGTASVNQTTINTASLESLIQQHQQRQQQEQQQQSKSSQPPASHQQLQPESSLMETFPVPAAPYPIMDNSTASIPSLNHIGNGDIPIGNGSVASSYEQSNGVAAIPSKPANVATPGIPKPTLANNLPSNVDLQALLTKLSPTTPTLPQQLHSTPQSPPQPNGAPGVAAPSSAPPSVQVPAPLSPIQRLHARTQSNTPLPHPSSLPQPPNHPLPPVPVVSSSVPGHPATGYPASLPPPPNFAQHKQQQAASVTEDEDDEDVRPFTVDEEEEFSRFLADERDYVTQGQWDRFPPGSRLFIGNLPTEKVTKRDLFRLFHKHGRLAQVSIKQAYGFVQFLDQAACASALRHEQGSSVRGRKMHLEISKPQRNTRPAPVDSARPRRSRSPDYSRGGSSPRRGAARGNGSNSGPREVDRYRGPPPPDRELRDRRDRDDYGSRRRSPPPLRARDDYRPGRRSRSRSPPARYRPRSRSRSPEADDVPLPRRAPEQVPEVQILVSDELDRNFIWWVENAFRQRGLTCDMLFLNPRLQLSAVVKRQVLEGVLAVVFLNRQMQTASKISIQVFDRRGEGEASFDQYDNLDPPIAAELVTQAKTKQVQHQHQQQAPPIVQYGVYGAPPSMQQPQQPLQQLGALASVPGLAGLLGNMDAGGLQKLIAGLQQPQQQQPPQQNPYQQQQQAPHLTADLASLLARSQATSQPQQQPAYGAPGALGNGLSAFAGTGLAALIGQAQQNAANQQQQEHHQHHQQQTQPNAGQIGNIMETLAKWKQS